MELLIPGLILVALMVYASTRIKRVAAEAFEAETIETAEFSIEKPEGFLNVIRPHDGLALEAYSKDFGSADAADFKAARAEIRIYRNRSLKYAAGAIREAAKVTSETTEVIDGRKYVVFEAEMVERGIGFREIYKLAESGGNVVELKFIVLETLPEAISAGVDAMLSSFTVK
ncbi:MAG: hypothetical protein KA746_00610 [Pyrinomonadaceae bacterium]|nr:hypothetical protein [Pyrinomonadaceae bacterium]MBP6213458.1 hypothetical protein [Pyrinomonadaceae bacterium]